MLLSKKGRNVQRTALLLKKGTVWGKTSQIISRSAEKVAAEKNSLSNENGINLKTESLDGF